ncbi:MarR family transcriptional regulator [Actinosynnema sp. ALI-1.44]|uniref:MarR family winged helix-turn-helix transcriptional regulator n=1 Tax=Actinosynnema sp. ALI-1.44 TaxID=1933779 RepID=UPI00097C1EFF|nr:MarR family transcriptional regulator [Actinosynnema sp. ALI-1.44]ONI74937.1 MarR family transcriptional regulator [Actinosynnema sp. ALI-1.44]
MRANEDVSSTAIQASNEVRAVISRLRRRILNAAKPEDITLGQASVLAHLASRGRATASELASADGVRHQSMTAMISSLAEAGLVSRSPDPDDRRRVLVTLTAAGRRRVEEGRQARSEWLARQLQDKCTEEERQAVIAAMGVLARLTHD